MTGLTADLARFASAPNFAPLPDRVVEIVQSGFIDTIGTMLAGRDEPVVQMAKSFVSDKQSTVQEAHLLMGQSMASVSDAALINATAGHALDFDDVALGGHPSTVLVPAVLAAGQHVNATGDQVLRAYLVGYEVWAELFVREKDAYHLKGWHPTAVLGTVGTSAAVAHLYGLSAAQCQHVIALAASMASGLVANFGTMTKPLHAGRAASCAIEAVRWVQKGLTAAPDALEHAAGFLSALSPHGAVDRTSAVGDLGRRFRILESGLSIKKYPTCYATHRVIDGVLDLCASHGVGLQDVAQVHTHIGVAQASMLRNHQPQTGLEAKFSLEFAVAASLVRGKVGLAELSDVFVQEHAVKDAMAKVKISTVDTQCAIEPVFSMHDRVQIQLHSGAMLDSGDIRFARGNAMLPLRDADLQAKFLDCVHTANLDGAALFSKLSSLTAQAHVRFG
ncbi:MmgE/PrpD family protein [Limnohabitans sp. Rim8]|uniref:MmgE/PrpD family protein n=1 Tax=Limnohabitans sp. Rim8 TaxID=1100718 RepID=UPI00260DFFF5|nr:MmgE/PrpD family protein [Limnohabitans sp. Rim8]